MADTEIATTFLGVASEKADTHDKYTRQRINITYYPKQYIPADTFSPITTDETFKINISLLNCNSKKFVYLSECKKCKNPYVGKAQTKFRMRLKNYKSGYKSLKTKKRETPKLFHEHYIQDDHEGKDNW